MNATTSGAIRPALKTPADGARASKVAGIFIVLASAVLPFLVTDLDTALVIAPMLAAGLLSFVFAWTLWSRRHGRMAWFEIGMVYVAVVVVYLTYPLIGYLALGQRYTSLNDGRLAFADPTAREIAAIGWLYVWHLLGFVLGYLGVRGRLPIRDVSLPRPGSPLLIAIVVAFVVIEAYGLFLSLFYNLSAATYIESYLVTRRLPLILAQLANHLDGIRYALSMMLMAALFTRYPKTKFVIAAWLIVEAAGTVVRLGSRTEFVLLVFAAAMMYDTLVRPLPVRFVVALGGLGLAGFVGFGIARMSVGGTAGQSHNPFVYSSEFESLFANVFHLTRIRSTIPDLPAAFFLTDITALIPQQLAPFTKISPADWYVTTYFADYAAQGGGFAFGTISEAVLSGGWVSALARGAALGFCFAAIHRLHVRRPDGFWIYVFYVWLATLSYQSFRNTTFYLLVLATFRFLPALVVVNLLAVGLRRALRQPANLVPAAAVKA